MTETTRAAAYLAAFSKTGGRAFDFTGRPILTDDEARLLARAKHDDAIEAFKRHVVVTMQLARLDWLDGTVV